MGDYQSGTRSRARDLWLEETRIFPTIRARRIANRLLKSNAPEDRDWLVKLMTGCPTERVRNAARGAVLRAARRQWEPQLGDVLARVWAEQRDPSLLEPLRDKPTKISDVDLRVLTQLALNRDPMKDSTGEERIKIWEGLEKATHDSDSTVAARARSALESSNPLELFLELLAAGKQSYVNRTLLETTARRVSAGLQERAREQVIHALEELALLKREQHNHHAAWVLCSATLYALGPEIQKRMLERSNPVGDAWRANQQQLGTLRARFSSEWELARRQLEELSPATAATVERFLRVHHVLGKNDRLELCPVFADLLQFFGYGDSCFCSTGEGLLLALQQSFEGEAIGNQGQCVWNRLKSGEGEVAHLAAIHAWVGGGGYGTTYHYIFRVENGFVWAHRGTFGD